MIQKIEGKMENTVFEYDIVIKEFHLDTFGHVNNATYLQIYEEARWQFITERGYGLKKIKKTGLGPVILEIKIRFIKELRLREKITIHSQTGDYGSKVGSIKQWITDSEGNICSDVEMKVGLFDTRERKLVEPTEDWLNAIR
ncbi:acyl-CoA thioesterase [Wandonia haliotis]|uniref:Acyl-CoA thioesterase n=2 Tax=Wandonia haliotis TaxID=574963 RepID=A0ABP3Y784_9FLAO